MQKPDIATRHDIILLVDSFYEKVKVDQLLGAVFAHVDWPKHLPVMYNFWSSMMLGEQSYAGNPFQKHLSLPIDKQHFLRWLSLFYDTVDENFTGTKADEIKLRAQAIAVMFQRRMGLVNV